MSHSEEDLDCPEQHKITALFESQKKTKQRTSLSCVNSPVGHFVSHTSSVAGSSVLSWCSQGGLSMSAPGSVSELITHSVVVLCPTVNGNFVKRFHTSGTDLDVPAKKAQHFLGKSQSDQTAFSFVKKLRSG